MFHRCYNMRAKKVRIIASLLSFAIVISILPLMPDGSSTGNDTNVINLVLAGAEADAGVKNDQNYQSVEESMDLKSIFVIGDSISVHYGEYLKSTLKGKFNFFRKDGIEEALKNLDVAVGGNGGDSRRVLRYLLDEYGKGNLKYDYIIVNCGLHDIKRDPLTNQIQVPVDEYEKNLCSIFEIIDKTGAKPVWIRTTMVIDERHNSRSNDFKRYNDDVIAYNAVADKVVKELSIDVIDLYSFSERFGDAAYIDHVHYKEDIRKLQAEFIAASLYQLDGIDAGTKPEEMLLPVFDVYNYGAVGDGVVNDTGAIQAAADACYNAGGGTIWLHDGTFYTAQVQLKSNVRLLIEKSARVVAYAGPTPVIEAYPEVMPSFRAIFYAIDSQNIIVEGMGTIDGNNQAPVFLNIEVSPPKLVRFFRCNNITVKDISLKNAVTWVQIYEQCQYVVIDNIKVDSVITLPSDGIDIIDCSHVIVQNCYVNSDDDSICLKSTDYTKGLDDIIIQNNSVYSKRNNGILFGTDSYGPLTNVRVLNNTVRFAAKGGIALKAVDGARVDNVIFDNIDMQNVGTPIFLRLGNRDRSGTGIVGYLKNVTIQNINVKYSRDKFGCAISGIPGYKIENVTLKNMNIRMGGGVETVPDTPPELESDYPKTNMFGELPAYGFYVRHAKDIKFENINIGYINNDCREWLITKDTENITVENCVDYRGKQLPYFENDSGYESDIIKELDCKDEKNKAIWSIQFALQSGDYVYGDRTYVFASIPPAITGCEWIRPSMDSKQYRNDPLVTFTVSKNATVYVAHADNINQKPSWLSEFEDTDEDVSISPSGKYSLYKKEYDANSVVVLGNNGHTTNNQYFIVVK